MSVSDGKVSDATSRRAANFSEASGTAAPSPDMLRGGPLSKSTAPGAHITRRQLATASLFALAALAILLPGLGRPKAMYFDEAYFVPEARAFIQGVPNPKPDAPPLAKPPLGKIIMAIGMKTVGDNSFGWRIAGAVCGALTVAAVYLWAFLLLQDAN